MKNLKLQPLIVIEGQILDSKAFYVVVDDIKYSTNSMLDAIDLIFKIFYVFDCQYPNDSRNLWELIQRVIYGIETPNKRPTVQNRVLEGALNQFLV